MPKLRQILAAEGLFKTSFDERGWLNRARQSGNPLAVEYVQWAIAEGHITPSASSVLEEFIQSRRLGRKEYRELAQWMKF